MSACSTCRATIIWARTPAGEWMPLNPRPELGGNVELVHNVAQVVAPSPEIKRYTSHFATCANANGHRKERRR